MPTELVIDVVELVVEISGVGFGLTGSDFLRHCVLINR
jgi:hypothetical protein